MNEHHNSNDDRRPERDQPPRLQPRIWVGSLADYNAGRLHGDWFDAAVSDEQLLAEVQAMLDASPEPIAEEYGIFDYDEFGAFKPGEYEDLRTITAVARGIAEHGPAYAHWAAYVGTSDEDNLDRFEETYLGQWNSIEDYAEQLLDDLGINTDALGPEMLQPYIRLDIEAFARDLSYELYVAEDTVGVHVFEA